MSTRVSGLFVQEECRECACPHSRQHSFHIYREASTDDWYIVDDFERHPIQISEKAAKEVMAAYELARRLAEGKAEDNEN